jgi:transcriptional/translational regulatory protein YebC/TACO1
MKNYLLIIGSFVLCFVILYIFVSKGEVRLHKAIIESEKSIRDSLNADFKKLQADRDTLHASIIKMQQQFSTQTVLLQKQIAKIKIDVPKIDYNAYSDSALVSRLMSGYRNN